MSFSIPNKAVPGGCVVALVGLLPIALGFLLSLGVWKACQIPPEERPEKWISGVLQLGGGALICVLLGMVMIYFGMRRAMRADMTAPFSESKPTMRF